MNSPHELKIDHGGLRAALGRFATGVTIVTAADGAGQPVGLTVNSFNALSLEPPLVLWSLRAVSPRLAAFAAARHFAVNVLADTQLDLARRFAASGAKSFDAALWRAGVGGAPVLASCCAVFECERFSLQQTGDHVLFIGRVERSSTHTAAPLVFQAGHYRSLGALI